MSVVSKSGLVRGATKAPVRVDERNKLRSLSKPIEILLFEWADDQGTLVHNLVYYFGGEDLLIDPSGEEWFTRLRPPSSKLKDQILDRIKKSRARKTQMAEGGPIVKEKGDVFQGEVK